MKAVINITEEATEHLKEVLASRAEKPHQCLRLVIAPGAQVGLVLDEVRREDNIIAFDNTPVLLLDPTTASAFKGATLDYADTPEGPRLTLIK